MKNVNTVATSGLKFKGKESSVLNAVFHSVDTLLGVLAIVTG